MVEVPIEYLIVFVTAMFIPLFIYLMKMNNETAKNAAKMDAYDKHLEDTKKFPTVIELIKQRLQQLEDDVKWLFRIAKNQQTRRGDDRDKDNRDSTYFPDGDIPYHGSE